MPLDSTTAFTFLSPGRAITRTFALCLERTDVFLSISGLVHLPAVILVVLIAVVLAPAETQVATSHLDFIQKHMVDVMLVYWTQVLLSMLCTIAGEGGMIRATADMYAGRTPQWYPSLREGLRRFRPLMLVAMATYGAAVAIIVATYLIGDLILMASNTLIGPVFVLVAFAVYLLGACVLLFLMVTVVPLYPVVVIEEKGPIDAFHRCMELSRGRRGYLFVGIVLLIILQLVLGRLLHLLVNGDDPASFFFTVSGTIVSFVPGVIFLPLLTVLRSVLYFSVRVDKEGLNKEVLQRELSEPVEYNPPSANYRPVSLVDEQQQLHQHQQATFVADSIVSNVPHENDV